MRFAAAVLVLALLTPNLASQTKKVVPPSAGREGSTAQPSLFSQGAGRIQQIVEGNAVMNTLARLTSVNLRMDGSRMIAAASRTLRGFKLSLGYTSLAPSAMSRTFATNRTGAETQPVQYVFHKDAKSATGSTGNGGEALVIELEGVIR